MLVIKSLSNPQFGPIDLTINAGQCVSLQGPSGAGKSVFLRALADLDRSDGEVYLDGVERRSFSGPQWRQLVGLVPAESGWWTDRVGDHFFGRQLPTSWLEQLGLSADALSWEVHRLSSGERQRLALARALCLNPKVLLLDEPTAALDPLATERVERLVVERQKQGCAVLLVTHSPEQAARLAEQSWHLRDGRLYSKAAAS